MSDLGDNKNNTKLIVIICVIVGVVVIYGINSWSKNARCANTAKICEARLMSGSSKGCDMPQECL